MGLKFRYRVSLLDLDAPADEYIQSILNAKEPQGGARLYEAMYKATINNNTEAFEALKKKYGVRYDPEKYKAYVKARLNGKLRSYLEQEADGSANATARRRIKEYMETFATREEKLQQSQKRITDDTTLGNALDKETLLAVYKDEGVYSNHPADKGGETYMGIARNYHANDPVWKYVGAA